MMSFNFESLILGLILFGALIVGVIWDDDYGFDEEFSKLKRVKQVEKIKISYEWVEEE